MTASDIPRYEFDAFGEFRLVCSACATPIADGTLCPDCQKTRNPCPPGCVADCKECVVEDCWVEVAA